MAPVDEALAQLASLEEELRGRQPEIETLTGYYDGAQPLRFASGEVRDWFGERYAGFADNWCAPVADAKTERMEIVGVRPRGQTKPDDELDRWWEQSNGPAESALAFSTAVVAKRSYGLVWGNEDDEPEVTFEHPSQAIVGYEPGSRRKRKAALKMWRDGSWDFATLYTDTEVWKFQRRAVRSHTGNLHVVQGARSVLPGGWEQRQPAEDDTWPLPNPLGVVPMVELQCRPKLLGDPLSLIAGTVAMQDAINALWSYLFTSADFAALPQRVILGAQLPKIPVLNDQGQKIGEKPVDLPEANVKRILNLEGPQAKIDQWDAAKLDTFTGVIEKAVSHIAGQTRTPIYYFANAIQNISGDTLKALDTGLVAQISEIKKYLAPDVREIYRLMALAAGDLAKARAIAGGTVAWTDHEVRSDSQKVDTLLKLGDLTFPFEYLAEQYVGGDADELARIMRMRKQEARTDPLSLLADRERQRNGRDEPEGDGAAA